MSDYPSRLIPASGYDIVDSVRLMEQSGLWLIRHVESGQTQFLGNTRTLNPDCITIQSDHLRDLSNNLFGVFLTDDVCFGIEKHAYDAYCCAWDGIEKCEVPSDGEYFRDEGRGGYFIPVDSLLKDNIEIVNAADGSTETFHFKILHTPTKCNYWHISIRVYDETDNEVSTLDVSKGKKKRIWKTVKDYLVTSIVKTEIDCEPAILDKAIYCRQ